MAKVAFSHGIVLIICCPPREKKENEAVRSCRHVFNF